MKKGTDAVLREGFGKRLNQALDAAGFDKRGRQARLAEAYGVTNTAAGNWLKGAMPSLDVLTALVRDLHINLNWLITGEGEIQGDAPTRPAPMDPALFSATVHHVNEAIRERGLNLSDRQMAALYQLVYERAVIDERLDPRAVESQIAILDQ